MTARHLFINSRANLPEMCIHCSCPGDILIATVRTRSVSTPWTYTLVLELNNRRQNGMTLAPSCLKLNHVFFFYNVPCPGASIFDEEIHNVIFDQEGKSWRSRKHRMLDARASTFETQYIQSSGTIYMDCILRSMSFGNCMISVKRIRG